MIKLKSDVEARPSRHLVMRLGLGLVLLIFGMLLAERWAGAWALHHWKNRRAKAGEVFEARRLWPQPTVQAVVFSNELQQAIAQLPTRLGEYAGVISGIVVQEPGTARRGSQEPIPVLACSRKITNNSWLDLAQQIRQAQPALQRIRALVKNPPGDVGYDVAAQLENFATPCFVYTRRAPQALHAAALLELHRGDLEAAKENLAALAACTKLYAQDPMLVNYMVRVAILGLSIEPAWDALQAEGWKDAQLAQLQDAFQCDQLLAQMPQTVEAGRASRLYELEWLSSHSYLDWVDRYQPIWQAFGHKLSDSPDAMFTRYFRQWVFHPVWRFAWADEEQLLYLEHTQQELEILRQCAKGGSGHELAQRIDSLRKAYRPPRASWRFYLALPLADQASEGFGIFRDQREYPYANFSRAWSTSLKNLTLCQMLRAAISLKRYQLRHGKFPESLEALVPEFAAKVPRDLMDGQPLRYSLRSDGSYCLYSVADDGVDDHGSPVLSASGLESAAPWNGRDWVWPRVEGTASVSAADLASH